MTQYRQVPAQVDLPALEHAVLDFWREQKIFAKSLEQSEGRPEWVFYEGPPTANGMPGAHHIEARVFKDVFPRFRTMRGYHVARKAGWDCHGSRWSWRSRRSWASAARRTSRPTASPTSTPGAASPYCATPTPSPS